MNQREFDRVHLKAISGQELTLTEMAGYTNYACDKAPKEIKQKYPLESARKRKYRQKCSAKLININDIEIETCGQYIVKPQEEYMQAI